MRRVSELPTPHELGQIAGRMWADELACYQEEKRAEIAATGVVPEDTRVNVEAWFSRLRIERDSTAFWEAFVEAIRTTDVSKWLRE
jgi:N-acetylglutamate synthase/N-acetylornithine aminotransferase